MRAAVIERYGGPEVLELRDVPRPEPKANECLVRVRAASINDWDWELMRGAPINRVMSGLTRPGIRIIGCDIAGQVDAVGAKNAERHADRYTERNCCYELFRFHFATTHHLDLTSDNEQA